MRGFWETLMHNSVQFRTLARCIKNMDVSIRAADRVYKWVPGSRAPLKLCQPGFALPM
jgi:hypothetical protein